MNINDSNAPLLEQWKKYIFYTVILSDFEAFDGNIKPCDTIEH